MGAGIFKDRCDLLAQFFPRLWPQFHNFVPKRNVKNRPFIELDHIRFFRGLQIKDHITNRNTTARICVSR